jgi:hypothetical protein
MIEVYEKFTEPPNISTIEKPVRRCESCDRETDDYIMFLKPDNSESYICWSCQARDEKNFNVKPTFHRMRRALRNGG